MLTPEYLLRISEGAEEIAAQLHESIINAVVERITIRLGRGDDYILTAKDKWELEVLEEAGYLREDLQAEIAKKTKLQLKEIREAFEDAGITSTQYDDEIYKAAGLSPKPLQQSPHLIRLMQRAYEATQGEWLNYTRTTADAAQQLFIKQCDKAYNLVSTGAVSYTEAVKNAVEAIAEEGVNVTYPSGHVDSIETATLRAVRTGVSQATAAITDARMDEMGWDIILVSSHLGARVTDAEDFTNHSWWQGKFYSKSGKDTRFPPFEVCGMGNVQGIHGANCRHHHMPGDGENNPFEQYDSEENRKQYELDQHQRALERRIRKTKRELQAAKTAIKNGDEATKAEMQKYYDRKAALLQKQNKAYNDFCEENGLKRLQDRLHVAGWNRSQASAASAAARKKQTSGIAKAGKVEANGKFVNNKEKLYKYAENIQPIEGFEDFTCHATADDFYIDLKGNGVENDFVKLTPEEYAEAIKNSRTYKGGNIRILSCQAGAKPDGAAQRLANALNVAVYAPTEIVNIDEKGNIFVSDNDILAELWYNADAEERKKFTETGKWILFKPERK